jgi:hypothetical protein
MEHAVVERPQHDVTIPQETGQVVTIGGKPFVATGAEVRFSYRRGRPRKMHVHPGTLSPSHEWGHKDGCD